MHAQTDRQTERRTEGLYMDHACLKQYKEVELLIEQTYDNHSKEQLNWEKWFIRIGYRSLEKRRTGIP